MIQTNKQLYVEKKTDNRDAPIIAPKEQGKSLYSLKLIKKDYRRNFKC